MRKFVSLLALILVGLLAAPAQAQANWAGDWHGTLTTPRGELRMLLTIRAGADGALTAELESVDQAPGQKIPVPTIAVAGGRLTFAVPVFSLTYEGTWDAAGNRFNGTLHQGADLPLSLERGAFPAQPVVLGLDGHWDGTVRRNNAELRFALRVTTGPGGTIASLDSPDQLAMGLPVSGLTREGANVRFTVPAGNTSFTGTLAGERLSGRWTDGGETTFVRRAAGRARRGAAAAADSAPALPLSGGGGQHPQSPCFGRDPGRDADAAAGAGPVPGRDPDHRLGRAGPGRDPARPQAVRGARRLSDPPWHRRAAL